MTDEWDIVDLLRSPEVFITHGQMISAVAYQAADDQTPGGVWRAMFDAAPKVQERDRK